MQMGDEADAALKHKIRSAFSVFDRDNRNACDVREVLACNFGMLFTFLMTNLTWNLPGERS